ncbi:MAG: hypothetical protein CME15_14630 [Gemmatimonadetes bacterium]|jgi:predicted nucleic acid-binding protein|nr:hypothetical protein [Gemmatimonadota bacterium]|tara:strand:- start:126 stop:347 length:222 start_codon:yes stop_codon:yes gene_type:complete
MHRAPEVVASFPFQVLEDRGDQLRHGRVIQTTINSSDGRTKLVVSGDQALLLASGYRGFAVLSPRQFVEQHVH